MKELKEYLRPKLERVAMFMISIVQLFFDWQHNKRYSKKCARSNHCFPIYYNGHSVSGAKMDDICQCKKYKFEELLKKQRVELVKSIHERQMKSKTKEL
jgi:hypothetical protein